MPVSAGNSSGLGCVSRKQRSTSRRRGLTFPSHSNLGGLPPRFLETNLQDGVRQKPDRLLEGPYISPARLMQIKSSRPSPSYTHSQKPASMEVACRYAPHRPSGYLDSSVSTPKSRRRRMERGTDSPLDIQPSGTSSLPLYSNFPPPRFWYQVILLVSV